MSQSERAELDGILVIDKPAGITSHDVVARVRRLLGVKRVGHGGTLDPFATGVLPVAVGRATRVLQYVQNADKGYRAGVLLGAETDTGDTEGKITAQRSEIEDAWPSPAQLNSTLGRFIGEIEQIPPAHSAIKVDGQPLYRRARAGEVVDVPPRQVHVLSINVLRYDAPELELEIACGKGTMCARWCATSAVRSARLPIAAHCNARRPGRSRWSRRSRSNNWRTLIRAITGARSRWRLTPR